MKLKDIIESNRQSKNPKLDLSGLGLKEIPTEISKLKHLKMLVLGDWIKDTPNKINIIPNELGNLKNLTYLDLRGNSFKEFPMSLLNMTSLKTIDLTGNNIESLPDSIDRLEKIECLYLSGNKLKNLPKTFNKLSQLKEIELEFNPMSSPPYEIAVQGVKAIRNYYHELDSEEETDYLNEIKLLLVGEGRVGKTTLSKRLADPKYKFKHENSTEGVNINTWIVSKDKLNINKNFKLNVWDFGGQEIYHATHQFFLTKRSIYILVTESRKEDKHEDFYYWLNTINILGDKSPIILVMNKCDQPSKEIPFLEYKKMFPSLVEYTKVGCKAKEIHTIEILRSHILSLLKNKELLPHIGNPLPKVWVDIRNNIENLLRRGHNHISFDRYLSICKKHSMDEERALFLSDYFHDIGVFLHFKDDLVLRETVFLNHEFITDGVYKVLDNKNVISNNGRFTTNDLIKIWCEKEYKSKRSELLSLMMNSKFELCFKLNDNTYLAPQLLPVEELEFKFNELNRILHFEIHYKFMPKGIITRFIVRRSSDIYNSLYWRYGVVLSYNDTFAVIKEKYFERKVAIQLSGKDPKTFLEIIRKTFKDIHTSFSNLEYSENIPCNCVECQDNDTPHLYNYNTLQRYTQKRKFLITCDNSLEEVSVSDIIDNIIKKSSKIFISYSHKDTKWLDRLNIHLKPLIRNGIIESWDDTKLRAGDKWESEILNHLSTSDVAILLISPDFLASDFITNNELPPILKKAENLGIKIICLNVNHSLFRSNKNLSSFQSFNDPSKPLISQTKNKQEEVLSNLAKLVVQINNS